MGTCCSSLLHSLEGRYAARKFAAAGGGAHVERHAVAPDAAWGADSPSFDHAAWDRALRRHVTPGGAVGDVRCSTVDYAGMRADPDVAAYTAALAAARVDDLPPNEQLALCVGCSCDVVIDVVGIHHSPALSSAYLRWSVCCVAAAAPLRSLARSSPRARAVLLPPLASNPLGAIHDSAATVPSPARVAPPPPRGT